MDEDPDELIPTRATLLHRLKDWQDQASWQVFFDIYWRLIYGVALKAGLSKTEAEEVVQETMLSVAKHMPKFEYKQDGGSFKGWLLTMTRWRITDQMRKRGPLTPVSLASDLSGSDTEIEARMQELLTQSVSHSLDKFWDAEWEKNILEAALKKVKRQLDPQKYQVFDFYVNKGWPAEKVATTFGISVNQVYLAKHRVTELIAAEVKKLEQQPN